MHRFTGGIVLPNGTYLLDGSGAPEGAVAAPPGSKYHRTDGSEYRKLTGTGTTGWALVTPGGSSVAPGAFVAASDATAAEKAAATHQCDGTADQVEIQAALDSGRSVALSSGTFSLSAAAVVSAPVVVRGSGWRTVLKVNYSGYALAFAGPEIQGAVFRDFSVDGNGAGKTAGGGIDAPGAVQCLFEFIRFRNAHTAGLRLAGNSSGGFGHHNKVLSCLFDATITVDGLGHGLVLTSSDENLVTSEFQYLGGLGGGAAGAVKTSAIKDTTGLNTYQNCVFVGGRNNARGVWVQDTNRSKVLGCTFDGVSGDNVFVTGTKHIIEGNIFTFIGDQGNVPASGVVLEFAVADVNVLNNYFESSATAGKTQSFVREPADGGGGNNQVVYNGYSVTGALGGPAFDLQKAGTIRFGNKGDAAASKAYVTSLGVPDQSVVALADDVSVATANTFADVTGLSFPVVAGVVYEFEFVMVYDVATTATAAKFSLAGPAFTGLSYHTTMTTGAAAGSAVGAVTHYTAYNLPSAIVGTVTPYAAGNLCTIRGVIEPSAAGTVVARFASETAGSAVTVKAKRSHVKYGKL